MNYLNVYLFKRSKGACVFCQRDKLRLSPLIAKSMTPDIPIAIVGIGGVFPDAPTLEQFWENIEQGISAAREAPPDRWPLSLEEMFDPERGLVDKVYSKRGCYITGFELESEGLEIDSSLIKELDPVFHLALHAAREALRDADLKDFNRSRCGVIIGNIALPTEKTSAITAEILGRAFEEKVLTSARNLHPPGPPNAVELRDGLRQIPPNPPLKKGGTRSFPPFRKGGLGGILTNDHDPSPLNSTVLPGPPQGGNLFRNREDGGTRTHPINRYAVGMVAGMISKALKLGAESYTVDGACAASLYAANYAVGELQAGRADVMLTGGVCRPDRAFTQMGFCQLGALSPTGVCAPFDKKGNGLVVGEGAGIFVLKRLDDAIREGNHIYALIKGIGVSNDRRGALLAPDSEGQVRAMRTAYQQADWSPQDVDLIECHATGTPVGDVVEFNSLRVLWGDEGRQPDQCVIGGVKSNVGHLLTGAGAAGLMKTVLALKHHTLPPTANFSRPIPRLDLENSPFTVLARAKAWTKRDENTPRRAAVSAFGFGGINAHVLLEEWTPKKTTAAVSEVSCSAKSTAIAIVGMDAHFGHWNSLRAFQERVLGGGELVEPETKNTCWGVDKSAWFQDAGLTDFPFKGYFVDELSIPIGRFRVPPKELQESLPQQLLMLQVAAGALGNAQIELDDKTALRTGAFIGIGLDFNSTNFSYRWVILRKAKEWANALGLNLSDHDFREWVRSLRDAFGPPLTANRTVGALGGIVASRIAREFRVGGPGITISSEETSGLRALNVAVRSLQQEEIDQAIVGAVDLNGDIRSILMTHAERPFSRSGNTRPFDTQADGSLPGEGAAAVILKRLDDAIRDGNKIYAVIKGVGTASGQKMHSRVADTSTYRSALDRAYQEAQIDPAAIPYLETHGSGNGDEDQMEAEALVEYFGDAVPNQPCAIGSVKADIGHTGAASGLASLLKASLCLYQKIIPSVRNLETPHKVFSNQSHRFYFPTGTQYWLRNRADGPRRAGVNSSGIDGSCVHVVLEAYEDAKEDPCGITADRLQPLGAREEALFVVAADDQSGFSAKLRQLQVLAEQTDITHIETFARRWWHQNSRDDNNTCGLALITRDTSELLNQIDTARQAIMDDRTASFPGNRIFYNENPAGPTGEMAFVFPGSGNHYPGMGRDISVQWPEILRRQDAQNQYLRSQYIPDLLWNTASPEVINRYPREILLGQVAYSVMMTDLIRSFGIHPQAVIGNSLGESSAFFALRAWSDRDEMLRRMMASPLYTCDLAGKFLAAAKTWNLADDEAADWILVSLQCSADVIRPVIEGRERVYLLIINTPESCVIGGERQALMEVVEQLGCNYHLLSGVSAAHCEIIKHVEQPYRELHYFETTTAPAGIRFYSTASGKSYQITPDSAADAILAQALDSINFPAVIEQAYRDGVRVFVEIGPGNSCSNMIDKILENQPHVAASACGTNYENISTVLRLLGKLIAEGIPVDLSRLYGQETEVVAHQAASCAAAKKMLRIPTGGQPFRVTLPQTTSHQSTAEMNIPQPASEDTGQMHSSITELVKEIRFSQSSKVQAHGAYLKLSQGLTKSYADQLAFQMSLIESMQKGVETPVFMTREQCLEFAVGSIAKVLGEEFAEIDNYPTRVRLPAEPLMLADRIIAVEGEPRSLSRGRVVTEHDIFPDDWYLDCGRIPTCIAVESGQADLFLSGYLGIDFVTQGLAVYRLLDAAVTFHRDLPGPGSVLRYDIHIDEFFRQGNMYLFRFRFDCTADDELLLTMRNGCAGFFTQKELAEGQGLVFSKMDVQAMPGKKPDDWRPLAEIGAVEAYSDAQVEALRHGNLAPCFGPQFEGLPLQDPGRLPGGRMKLVHRVLSLESNGGRYGLGQIRAEADIHPHDWFLTCHFVDDQVMPGTLMYECCLHTLRILLMRMGWVGEQHEIAWQPVPGVAGQLKCRGQVIATTHKVIYEVSIKEIGYRPEPYVICDAIMYADNKPVVRMIDMSSQLSGMTREKLEEIWSKGDSPRYHRKPAIFDSDTILAFSNGKPSEAFGERYKVFDEKRVIARLPGPPYQFLDRITDVQGEQWVMTAGKAAEAQYDVPPNEWYFATNRYQKMPFAVLLEIVLQPCGWLAAYSGSALTSDIDLSFRNLGGEATQFLPVGRNSGTLTTIVKMTSVSTSGGMIIQHYDYDLTNSSGEVIYQGNTYFGFFMKHALADQIGIRDAGPYQPTTEEITRGETFIYPQEPPFPEVQLRMVDKIDLFVADGGPYGLGFIRGSKKIIPDEWFFNAHFYQDPVWPGSLGLEAFLQLLKVVAVKRWGWQPHNRFETMALNRSHQWTYRGQVIPTDHQVTIQAVVTSVDDSQHLLEAKGFLIVDGRVIYQMENFSIRLKPAISRLRALQRT